MGNWMTVRIVGTCDADDVPALRKAIDPGPDYLNLHCLSGGSGVCGIGDWASADIDRVGNVAERDYTPEDVAEALGQIVKAVPSLTVKVHCGGDYESKDVVATVICEGGKVTVGEPEEKAIPEIPKSQMRANFMSQLMGF